MKKPTVPRVEAPGALPPPAHDQVGLLADHLQAVLPHAHRARLKGVALALLALSVASSVTLTKVARACAGRAQVGSHYRRLQRLLANFAPLSDGGTIARGVTTLVKLKAPWTLSLDRTEWQPVAGCRG